MDDKIITGNPPKRILSEKLRKKMDFKRYIRFDRSTDRVHLAEYAGNNLRTDTIFIKRINSNNKENTNYIYNKPEI
jgi:hypothetical protein